MSLKKSQLYSSLWSSCDELRGGMDASQYKDYVLTLLFLKYVSDKHDVGSDTLLEVPAGGSFRDIAALKGDKNIGEKIDVAIAKLAEANGLKGVIDQASFNDDDKLGKGKEMVDRLSKLIAIFEGLDFRANRAEGDDLLGDAYEYLMRHFATESGKSKGQFYTPAEVSRIMAKIVGIEQAAQLDQPTVYDPTCGSGSLLIKAADEAGTSTLAIYGQENDLATWSLARMNMILHGHETHEIWKDNTLAAPYFKNNDGTLKTFDFAVANPPFSAKSWSNGFDPENDLYGRFAYGVPPRRKGDYAFLLHLIASLRSKGKGAIILPHGVLFRGQKEADIRRTLVQRGLIKGIVGLPANLFYGTGIPACIVVIDKENAHTRTGIFMIDASKGCIKDGNKNRLRAQDIHKIVDVFTKQTELAGYSRMVPVSEIAEPANDYNLNLPRYIDSSEPEDLHDLDAHLNGGIPARDVDAMASFWDVFPSLRATLFKGFGRDGYQAVRIGIQEIRPTVLEHPEFLAYAKDVASALEQWRKKHEPLLKGMKLNDRPKEVIHALSEDLLSRFADVRLLSRYDVYQRLMDYWLEEMQDDVYLIAADGWVEAAQPRLAIDDKERKIKETPDLKLGKQKYKMDLVPPALIVARYFAAQQAEIEALQAKRDAATAELEEYVEEHSGEEGLLEDVTNDKGKVTKKAVQDRLKEIKGDAEFADEATALKRFLKLIDAESRLAKDVREAQAALDEAVLSMYPGLSEDDVKSLVVDDKWLPAIRARIEGEVQRLAQQLAGRVRELDERYSRTMPQLEQDVAALDAKVAGHLKEMGLVWA